MRLELVVERVISLIFLGQGEDFVVVVLAFFPHVLARFSYTSAGIDN